MLAVATTDGARAQTAPSTLSLVPVADTYSSARAAHTNYGKSADVRVTSRSHEAKVGFLRFSVPVLSKEKLVKAQLVLHRTTHHLPASSVSARTVLSSGWSESLLTSAKAPKPGSILDTVHTQKTMSTVTLDVTAAVKASATVAFALTSGVSNDAFMFASREAGAAGPRLVLTVKPNPTTTAPATTAPATTAPATTAPATTAPATTTPAPSTTTAPATTAPATTAPATTAPTTPAPSTTTAPTTTAPSAGCAVSRLLVASCARWFGIAPRAWSGMAPKPALDLVEGYSGAPFAEFHRYNTNGTLFPTAADLAIARQSGQNRVLFENWKPATDMTWAQVAAGGADGRIDAEAAYLKSTFDSPFLLTVWHEPENDVNATPGSGMTVADYVAMFRHVVLRLRADGANKFLSVMNYMGFSQWNYMIDNLYPGDDVVDWIAWDPYMHKPSGAAGHDFKALIDRPTSTDPGFYTWATTRHAGKPLMLGEWGAYTDGSADGQAQFLDSVGREIDQFPALRALIYWEYAPTTTADGPGTTPAGSQSALAAWRNMVRLPAFATPPITYTGGSIVATS